MPETHCVNPDGFSHGGGILTDKTADRIKTDGYVLNNFLNLHAAIRGYSKGHDGAPVQTVPEAAPAAAMATKTSDAVAERRLRPVYGKD